MASNALPQGRNQIVGLATNMLAGLNSLGTTLGITQVPPADFQGMLDAFIAGDGDFNAKRDAKQAALDSWKAATGAMRDWLLVVRTVLAGRFGSQWSAEWAAAGFVDTTTAVPEKHDAQLLLTLSLANFFTANPSYQVTSMLVTATQATTLRTAALAAQQGVVEA